MREQMLEWIAEHSHELATAALIPLAGLALAELGQLVIRWLQAWRHARAAQGCAGCARMRVDAVAYPEGTGPLAYCRPCLGRAQERLQLDELEPIDAVGLRRPVDVADVVAAVWLALIIAPLVALVIATLMLRS